MQIGSVIAVLEVMKMETEIILSKDHGAIPGVKYRVMATATEGETLRPNGLIATLEQLENRV